MNQLTPAPLPGVELAAAADVAKAAPAQIALPVLYSITIFLSAGLVFSIQPIVAKMVLPLLGGAPAVWTTCMLFFQGMLLAGYVYAHLISRRWTPRAQCGAHLALLLLGGLMLPLGVANPTLPGLVGQANPAAWLLKYLLASAGLPFFVLSASAPLLQQWFSNTRHPSASDPYFLYSASNLGSLLALLSYPILVEPTLRIATQSQLWSTGYAVLVLLLLFCAATHWGAGCAAQPEAERKRQPKEADFLQAEISRSLQSAVGNPLSRPTDTLSPSDGERDGV
ncbi:MAG: hypothetical protein HY735_37020, partial [Verrucomicrobia bacterium]|nr:hypothetical protein [Verrucomicrobiota bacterium]